VRILHTEWSDGLGGQEKRVLMEAGGFKARGHHAVICCRAHSQIRAEAEAGGIDVHVLPMRKPYDAVSILRLRRFLKAEKFDVVNTHSGCDSWIGGIAAKLAGVKVLVRTRHLNIPLRRNPLNFVHYLPDVYISCGDNMRDTLVGRCGFPKERVVSIPTGVEEIFFGVKRDSSAAAKYGVPPGAFVVANVGVLRRVKGHEVTLRAVGEVVAKIPQAVFLIVGDGPRRAALEDLAHELGVDDHVIFTGHVRDIPEVYSFSDAAVLSSLSEGLPQSVVQAMAAGVAVVATSVGGVAEVVRRGETGQLVESGDHKALAAAIVRLFKDRGPCMDMAENAKRFVRRDYSSEIMLDKLEALYERLLKGA
jgi:glycosyltransferase involved in cell wall biosynthesis